MSSSTAAQQAAKVAKLNLADPSLLKEQCYIDGKWVGAPSKAVDNPANGEIIGHVPFFGAAETTQAVEAAYHQRHHHPDQGNLPLQLFLFLLDIGHQYLKCHHHLYQGNLT